MHLDHFTHLPMGHRFAYAAEKGTFIVNDSTRRAQYFQLHDFYVEVRRTMNGNTLRQVVPFRAGLPLDRMLECITRKALCDGPVGEMIASQGQIVVNTIDFHQPGASDAAETKW